MDVVKGGMVLAIGELFTIIRKEASVIAKGQTKNATNKEDYDSFCDIFTKLDKGNDPELVDLFKEMKNVIYSNNSSSKKTDFEKCLKKFNAELTAFRYEYGMDYLNPNTLRYNIKTAEEYYIEAILFLAQSFSDMALAGTKRFTPEEYQDYVEQLREVQCSNQNIARTPDGKVILYSHTLSNGETVNRCIYVNNEDDLNKVINIKGVVEPWHVCIKEKDLPQGYDSKNGGFATTEDPMKELDETMALVDELLKDMEEEENASKKEIKQKKVKEKKVSKKKSSFSILQFIKNIFLSIWSAIAGFGKGLKRGIGRAFRGTQDAVSELTLSDILSAILPALAMITYVVLLLTGVLSDITFSPSFNGTLFGYDFELSGLMVEWLENTDHGFFSAITLGLLQIILIVIGFLLDLVIHLLLLVLAIVWVILVFIFSMCFFYVFPVAITIWLVINAIKVDSDRKALAIVCMLIGLACCITYFIYGMWYM